MRVVVLAGGRSSEHDVSLASAASVTKGLEAAGHDTVLVEISREGRWSRGGDPVWVEPAGGLLDADAVFPVLHGPFGEDGTVQGLLEIADVPYVGAGVLASAISMDKLRFKDLAAQAGLPQVDYVGVREAGERSVPLERLGLPVFVKPARLGSSVGISKVERAEDLDAALDAAFAHDPLVIVEAMARGREVECSVLGDSEPIASEPGEILIDADWYDYEAKYTPGGMELVVPARISSAERDRIRALAIEVFQLVDCSGMARVDFFIDDERGVLVNELNTIPGFTDTSVYAKLFGASGVPYAELCDRLVRLALERHERERAHSF